MRIAIIGASGLLGRHTVEAALAAGHEVVAAARRLTSLDPIRGPRMIVQTADLDDRASLSAALNDVDAVINCAAYYPTFPRPWRTEVDRAIRQMDTFYRACAERRLRKIIYLGGAIALKKRSDGKSADEEDAYPEQPGDKNPYIQVKWALDRQALAQAKSGLPVVVGIPTMSFGEYDDGRSTGRLVLEMARGSLPGYIKGRRNVIYAGDAGKGLVRCAEAGSPGERYLLAGENLTMTELVEKIAAATGRPMPRRIPLQVARAVSTVQALSYKILGGPAPKLTASAIAVMSAGQFIDGAKANRELGFKAETSIDEAIERTLNWLKKRGLVPPR